MFQQWWMYTIFKHRKHLWIRCLVEAHIYLQYKFFFLCFFPFILLQRNFFPLQLRHQTSATKLRYLRSSAFYRAPSKNTSWLRAISTFYFITGHLPKTLLDFEPFLHSILLGGSDNSPFNEIHLNSYSSFRQLITNEQRRIFIFRALGYFKLGAFLEGSRRLMSYKLALHVRKLLQFITILLYSEFPRYQQQKQSHWTQRKSRRGSYLTTLPLHIYWVPCAITRFASVKSSLWIKHLYFLRHLTGVTFLACYCS